MEKNNPRQFYETAYDEWFADVYDEWYPDLWRRHEGPVRPLRKILRSEGFSGRNRSKIRILDCACGTANVYVFLSKLGYDIWGTDGSQRMLDRAVKNCHNRGVSAKRLMRRPVQWTDWKAYERNFKEDSFDLLLLNSNSFCHLPGPLIPQALENFRRLLKPNGCLLIDTKRYRAAGKIKGVPIFKELRFVNDHWIIRKDRTDKGRMVERRKVSFHSSLHYDVDPCFKICRALVVVTMYGTHRPRRTTVWPYYPLPAKMLKVQMTVAGFRTRIIPARDDSINWTYDFLIGTKRVP